MSDYYTLSGDGTLKVYYTQNVYDTVRVYCVQWTHQCSSIVRTVCRIATTFKPHMGGGRQNSFIFPSLCYKRVKPVKQDITKLRVWNGSKSVIIVLYYVHFMNRMGDLLYQFSPVVGCVIKCVSTVMLHCLHGSENWLASCIQTLLLSVCLLQLTWCQTTAFDVLSGQIYTFSV